MARAEATAAKTGEAVKKGYVGIHATGFRDFLLKSEISRAIADCGFEHPSEVQHECIPQAILGMDIICQAKSGMGKTAVFVIAVLQQLEPTDDVSAPPPPPRCVSPRGLSPCSGDARVTGRAYTPRWVCPTPARACSGTQPAAARHQLPPSLHSHSLSTHSLRPNDATNGVVLRGDGGCV